MLIEEQFGKAFSKLGVSAQELKQNIQELNQVLCTIDNKTASNKNSNESTTQTALWIEIEHIQEEFNSRITALELQIAELRSAMNAKTENPKQKGDLEISSQIEQNSFLPGFVDLDSEDFIQQQPLWDFTINFDIIKIKG